MMVMNDSHEWHGFMNDTDLRMIDLGMTVLNDIDLGMTVMNGHGFMNDSHE